MNNDQTLRDLNDRVYLVDPKYKKNKYATYVAKPDKQLKGKEENTFKTSDGRRFRVISTENGNFGFQGMAVAPIVNGKPDYNQVTVAAAGTDPSQALDLLEAVDGATNIGSLQEPVAEKFVEKIMIDHPDWNITQLTGYSQSAYMLKLGAKYQIPTVAFNGWFQYGTLSAQEKDFMKHNPDMFINYRRGNDSVTFWNDFNSEFFNSEDYGTIVWVDGKSHNLADWEFDKNGMVVLPNHSKLKNARRVQAERLLQIQMSKNMLKLDITRRLLTKSGGGLSTNEKRYLDSEAARIIVQKLSSDFKLATENLIKLYQDAIVEAQELWQKTLNEARSIGFLLNEWEVVESLHRVGFTEHAIVTTPCNKYQNKISKILAIASDFDTLTHEIEAKITEIVQRDSELAQQLKGI